MAITNKIKSSARTPQLISRRIRGLEDLRRFPQFKNARLVTFDVFDTALSRSVARPPDVFALAAWRVAAKFRDEFTMETLLHARIEAEREARINAHAQGRQEVTLDEIYGHFGAEFVAIGRAFQSEELATEMDVCAANPFIFRLYRELIETGTKVAFISDTFLSQSFLESLLARNGFDGPHRVFASSEFGRTKAHGALFQCVVSATGLSPSEIWHIGDNSRSDVIQARKAGIHGLWYRPALFQTATQKMSKCADEKTLVRSLVAGISEQHEIDSDLSAVPWKKIGLTVAGPIYLGFTQWLIEQLITRRAQHIYFLSRDGLITKRVYDCLRPLYPHAPCSSYLMISRRSVVLPGITKIDEPALEFLCGNQLHLPVAQFLSRIGLQPEAFVAALSGFDLAVETVIDTHQKRERLKSFFKSIQADVMAIADRERTMLMKYLKQEGCFAVDRLSLCDIGWDGTMQRAMAPLIQSQHAGADVSGFYVSTSVRIKRLAETGGYAAGWFVDTGIPESRRRVLQSGRALAELFFTANHGSVLSYREEQERIVPTLGPTGTTSTYVEAAQAIQDAAMLFVNDYVKAFGGLPPLTMDREDAFRAFTALTDQPTVAEANAIGDLIHIDGFGATEAGQPIAVGLSPWQILFRPKASLARFRQSPWRLGILVRTFKAPKLLCAAMNLRRHLEIRRKGL